MGHFLAKAAAALLALCAVLPAQAEKLPPAENAGSGPRLREPESLQESDFCIDEALLSELEKILEESVDEALKEQAESLALSYESKNARLLKSRSFWRRAAVLELAVIGGAVLGAVAAGRD